MPVTVAVALALFATEAQGSSPASRRAIMSNASAEIAFVHRGKVDEVRVMPSDGSQARTLMVNKNAVTSALAEGERPGLVWARNGRRLLAQSNYDLRTVERDGAVRKLQGASCNADSQLSWSPDTHTIVCRFGDGIGFVGPVPRGLPPGLFADTGAGDTSKYEPAWSPDGKSIAYIEGIGGAAWLRIYDFATHQSGSRDSSRGGSLVHAPAWSPNGRWLAFSNHCTEGCKPTIWIERRDGEKLQRVVRNGLRPTWSPDGKEIAFDSDRDGDWEIYVVTLATGRIRQLTHNNVDDIGPSWRRLR